MKEEIKKISTQKMSVSLDLFPKAVNFDKTWERLKQATLTFIAGPGHISKAVWKERFSYTLPAIKYFSCTACKIKFWRPYIANMGTGRYYEDTYSESWTVTVSNLKISKVCHS